MNYKNNHFYIENVSAEKIAKKYGTPLYSYSLKKLKNNIQNFKNYFKSFNPLICFSVKSNSNLEILKQIKKMGLGADVVSQGEMMKALKARINSKKIIFSGVGKTSKEISYAIDKKILLINAESQSEIKEIQRIAKSKKKIVDIGIRLNPNTDAQTLNQISTGKKENKFGVGEKKFLELVNYIQHYGLTRNIYKGKYERFSDYHSWNSRHISANWSTFNLGLHSEHHKSAGKHYPLLSQEEKKMEMPSNYSVMLIMALIPPIWFFVMNRKLEQLKSSS